MLTRFTLNPTFPSFWREVDEMLHATQTEARQFTVPPADIVDGEKAVEIKLDMPGVDPAKIDVKLENDQLTVTAERFEEKKVEAKGWVRRERSTGRFSRSFTLPHTLDGTTPEATFRHGVLTITLPKREETLPRSLKVKVEA